MNISDLTYLLNKPETINEKQTIALENVVLQFPYFQAARALHLKGLYNQDALVWLLGFKHDFFSLGYSYDLTISKLGPGTAGSHELSMSYEFDNPKRRKKKVSPIPCPKF